MEIKIIACILYKNLPDDDIGNKNILICNLFKITKSTLYRWINEYDNTVKNIDNNVIFNFNSNLITKPIVCYVIYLILSNVDISYKKIKKELNNKFINNNISIKHIHCIIEANKHICNKINYRQNYKLNKSIQDFVLSHIKNNNCSTANEISKLIEDKFKIKISLGSIYNLLKKNNYVYKKTTINVNPYSYDEQKNHLTNVYNNLIYESNIYNYNENFLDKMKNNYIKMNNLLKKGIDDSLSFNINTNVDFIDDEFNDIKQMNFLLNEEIGLIKTKNIISIDEMSIITNRASSKGWSLKNNECIINIPFIKPNERYSLLMATSEKKIIKYILVKGSIKTDNFISFMNDLNNENPNRSYLLDNASIHKNKKTHEFYKKNKIHIVFNAPYQSKFNPIEMVFSLLGLEHLFTIFFLIFLFKLLGVEYICKYTPPPIY